MGESKRRPRAGVDPPEVGGSVKDRSGESARPSLEPEPAPNFPPLPAELPCVGRNEELAQILGALVEAERGRGSSWVVTGPAGIGKSRLFRRIDEIASQRGLDVRWGHGLEGSLTPLLPFREMLRGAQAGGKRAAGGSPGRTASPDPWMLPVDLALIHLIDEVELASEERPQVVLIDDLQFADVESLRCLRQLVRRSREHAIVIVAAARSDLPSQDSGPFRGTIQDLRRAGWARWIELAPLSEPARLELLAALTGRSVVNLRSLPGVQELVRVAGGTPYFLLELAAAWFSGPPPHQPSGAGAVWIELPVSGPEAAPTAVREVILQRLRTLPEPAPVLLGLAARLGAEFEAEPLAIGARISVEEAIRSLGSLASQGWPVRQVGLRPARFAFEHDRLRAVVLTSPEFAPEPAAVSRICAWWPTHAPEDPWTESRLRASAGDVAGSLGSLERALEEAFRRRSYRSLGEMLLWGTRDLPGAPHPELVRLYLYSAARLRAVGALGALAGLLADLRTLTGEAGFPWIAQAWSIEANLRKSPPDAARRLESLGRAPRANGTPQPEGGEMMLRYLRALLGCERRPGAAAHRQLSSALRSVDADRHAYEALVLRVRDAMTLGDMHRWGEAHARLRESQALVRGGRRANPAARDLLRHASSHLAFREGNPQAAAEMFRHRVRACRRDGEATGEAHALLQQGTFEFALRRIPSALRHLDAAESLFSKLDDLSRTAAARLLRGWTLVLDGEWTRAQEAFHRAEILAREQQWPNLIWASQVGAALARAELGDPRGARDALPALAPRVMRRYAYVLEYWCARARILDLCGEPSAARAALRSAVFQARTLGAPRTDLAEAYGQLARWESRYGRPTTARRWKRRFEAERLRTGAGRHAAWSLLGGGTNAGSARGPAHAPRGLANRPGSSMLIPIGHRIMQILAFPSDRTFPGSRSAPRGALTEEEIGTALQEDRGRFARALGRLRQRGLIDRERIRPVRGPRSRFAYRLTPLGIAEARSQGPGVPS
jgi:tetratricopeptide (TPR) repeat protein